MRENIQKLDYVGFSFNGLHSSQFGIKSVSSSNRYTRGLLPASSDISIEVNGGSGSYYFGSELKNRTFNLTLAFDDVTEQEVREISRWLYANGGVASLIFDELPYIQYYARMNGTPDMKYLVFDDAYGARVYKGELNITFTAYDPYGYSVHKYLSEYNLEDNAGEWSEASALLQSQTVNNITYDTFIPSTHTFNLYNPGDVEVDFILTLTVNHGTESFPVNRININLEANSLILDTTGITNGATIVIDTKKHLIKVGAVVANNILIDGSLFKIPVSQDMSLTLTGVSNAAIEYLYKYL